MTLVSRNPQKGQVAVLFAIALVAIVAVVGLAVDGGQSFVANRALQAGSDTGAQSGAYMLQSDYVACESGSSLPYDDKTIYTVVTGVAGNSVSASETANPISGITASYVLYSGSQVTYLPIPDTATTNDLCTSNIWQGVSGVQVSAFNSHHTALLGVIGIPLAAERATATAIFGPPTGAASPFAAWFLLCTSSTTGTALANNDPVVLWSPQWKDHSCPRISPSSFKGYIYPQQPITLPLQTGTCIQTGVGVGSKVGIASGDLPTLGDTYLIPMISAAVKGVCPAGTPGPDGTYALTYSGLVAVKITKETQNTIDGVVTNVAPPTNGITICPVGNLACNGGLTQGGPLGVELYR